VDKAEGLSLWIDWSDRSNKHDKETCERKWKSFKAVGKLTIATLFKLAGPPRKAVQA